MPTSYAVLDSGILLATVQTEVYTEQAKGLIAYLAQEQVQLAAPALLHYELVAVLRKWVFRGYTTPEQADHVLTALLHYPVTLHFDEPLLRGGYDLAAKYHLPTAYDSQYLALTERLSCDFWTIDERLFATVNGKFPHVHWLGNWGTET